MRVSTKLGILGFYNDYIAICESDIFRCHFCVCLGTMERLKEHEMKAGLLFFWYMQAFAHT